MKARVCEYCGRPRGVDKFREERSGRWVLVWAHLRCFLQFRRR